MLAAAAATKRIRAVEKHSHRHPSHLLQLQDCIRNMPMSTVAFPRVIGYGGLRHQSVAAAGGRRPRLSRSPRYARLALNCSAGRETTDPDDGTRVRYLYDGECPLRLPEVEMLKRLDGGKCRIDFVDIAQPSYDPSQNQGISYEDAMGKPAAILADGSVIRNVEVYKKLYEAVGLGFVWKAAELPVVGGLVNWVFDKTVELRLPLTGRPPIEEIIAKRSKAYEEK